MSSDITPKISDKRRSFSSAFKMNIAQLALAGTQSVSAIARQYDINANCIFRDDLASDFGMSRPPISVSSGH